jgi:hypothetical protein
VRVCEVLGFFYPSTILSYPYLPSPSPYATFYPSITATGTPSFSTRGCTKNCTGLHPITVSLLGTHPTPSFPIPLHYIPPFIAVLWCLHNQQPPSPQPTPTPSSIIHHPLHHPPPPPSATSHYLPSSINHLSSPITSITHSSPPTNQLNSHS